MKKNYIQRLVFIATCFLLLCVVGRGNTADYTTAKAVLMDWTLLDDTAGTPFLESSPLVTDTWLITTAYIDVAHAYTLAAGTAATVKVWAKSGTTDEDWHETMELTVTAGTANSNDIDQVCASGQPNVYVTLTTNMEASGDVYFLKDVGTLADSCLIVNGNFVDDDYIICVDNLVNAYDTLDRVYDLVDQWQITLSPGFTYRFTFHNTDADATYACRIHYTAETDIE